MNKTINPGSIAIDSGAAASVKTTIQPDTSTNSAMPAGIEFGTYPGGKSGAGTYQTIINQQPPHQVFISAFLGHCGIMRNKRPAARNIGIDLCPGVIAKWNDAISETPGFEMYNDDTLDFVRTFGKFFGIETLFYFDPPYLMETRSSGRLYEYEMTDDQHRQLLVAIKKLPGMVQISGYPSDLYAHELADWRMIEFDSMTRGGLRRECLWMNYPDPASLHTTWYVGDNYRERERIKRKRLRWEKRIAAMQPAERQVILEALLAVDRSTSILPVLASTAADGVTVPK